MAKQNVRNGRLGKEARQRNAENPLPDRKQWWCTTTKCWIKDGGQ